jgi:hypothetical protein
MNRVERRQLVREKENPFRKGWINHPSPKNLQKFGTGWFAEMDRVYRSQDNQYVAMIRTVKTDWGEVEHAAIRNLNSTDIPWAEKQKIKNELFGTERIAIEVFPKESELVDAANMYHLWVLPVEMDLPFGIHPKNKGYSND